MNSKVISNKILIDDEGISYLYVNSDILSLIARPISFKDRTSHSFYRLSDNDDCLLKIRSKAYVPKEESLLKKLILYRDHITQTEFPYGYLLNKNNVVGQIIRYYPNSLSLRQVCAKGSLDDLMNYCKLSDDKISNLSLICLRILDIIEELFDDGIAYSDIHAGNILFSNNEIKLIDFEEEYIQFSKMNYDLFCIIRNYCQMVNDMLHQLGFDVYFDLIGETFSFDNAKRKVLQLENVLRYR